MFVSLPTRDSLVQLPVHVHQNFVGPVVTVGGCEVSPVVTVGGCEATLHLII